MSENEKTHEEYLRQQINMNYWSKSKSNKKNCKKCFQHFFATFLQQILLPMLFPSRVTLSSAKDSESYITEFTKCNHAYQSESLC